MSKSEVHEKDTPKKAPLYEAGFHIVPTVSVEMVPEIFSDLKSGIEKSGGTIVSEEFPKKMALAYTMVSTQGGKKEQCSEAYFGWIKFEGDGEDAVKVDELFKEHESILRYLITKTVRKDTFFHDNEEEGESQSIDVNSVLLEQKDDKKKRETTREKVDEKKLDDTIDRITA